MKSMVPHFHEIHKVLVFDCSEYLVWRGRPPVSRLESVPDAVLRLTGRMLAATGLRMLVGIGR